MRYVKRVKYVFVSVVALLAILAATPVGQVQASTLVLVSANPSPYTGCSTAGQPGTVYVNAEVEPQVAVNPHLAGNIIGVWQQDRWSNGGAQGIVAGFSFDGGATWGQTTLPFSACAPNAILDPFTGTPYNRASDPWVSIGPDGTAYSASLLATNTTAGVSGGNNDTGVAAVTSSDGGRTWGNARLIKSDQGTTPIFEVTHFFNDKESVTADPIHAGTAYTVWDRLKAPSHSPDAALRAHAFRGPTWFSKTTDGGNTWTGTRAIFDPGQNSQTIGNVIVVNPKTDVLYDFFEEFSDDRLSQIHAAGPQRRLHLVVRWRQHLVAADGRFEPAVAKRLQHHRHTPSHRRGPSLGRHRREHRTAVRGLGGRSLHGRNRQPGRDLYVHQWRSDLERTSCDQ